MNIKKALGRVRIMLLAAAAVALLGWAGCRGSEKGSDADVSSDYAVDSIELAEAALDPILFDSVITKFRSDNRSFEEFVLMGRMECYNDVLYLTVFNDVDPDAFGWTELSYRMYDRLHIQTAPLIRLLEVDSIKKHAERYILRNKSAFEAIAGLPYRDRDTTKSPDYQLLSLCDSLFSRSDGYKNEYLGFVSDTANYILPNDDNVYTHDRRDIRLNRKDYLEHYFIKHIWPDCYCEEEGE